MSASEDERAAEVSRSSESERSGVWGLEEEGELSEVWELEGPPKRPSKSKLRSPPRLSTRELRLRCEGAGDVPLSLTLLTSDRSNSSDGEVMSWSITREPLRSATDKGLWE